MMNILLTDKCSNNCPYCFAKEKLEADTALNQMPLENYVKCLDFLKKSRSGYVKLLGGEPMLHSEISQIIKMTVSNDDVDRISVFTGGIFDRSLVHLLTHEKINVILNTNHPDDYKENKWEVFMRNLDYMVSLGVDVTPGYNIYKVDFDYEFMLELLDYYKIKNLRWTVAVPMGSYENLHVPLDDYRKMGKKITEFLLKFADMGVQSRLDCFVPLCTFSDSDYGKLVKIFPQMAKGGYCKPAIDVGPDLTVWRCFAVSSYENVTLEDFPDLKTLSDYFISTFDHYKWHVYPPRCDGCKYRIARICQGSCLAFKVKEISNFIQDGKKVLPLLEKGRKLFEEGDFSGALRQYEEALKVAPYSLETRAEAALLYIKTGRFEDAEKMLSEIEREYPAYPSIHVYRALICEEKKDFRNALKNYRKALRLCPKDEKLRERIEKVKTMEILNLGIF